MTDKPMTPERRREIIETLHDGRHKTNLGVLAQTPEFKRHIDEMKSIVREGVLLEENARLKRWIVQICEDLNHASTKAAEVLKRLEENNPDRTVEAPLHHELKNITFEQDYDEDVAKDF